MVQTTKAAELLQLAAATVGQGASSGTTGPYARLIATSEADARDAAKLRDLLRMSGCGLTVRGWLQRAGVWAPRLLAPYRIGAAVADVVALAREAGAWMPATGSTRFRAGDLFLIAAPEHIGIIEGEQAGSLQTIDGGARDAQGLQVIARHARPISRTRAGVMLGGRPLIGTIDSARLIAHHQRPTMEPVS